MQNRMICLALYTQIIDYVRGIKENNHRRRKWYEKGD
jgi:hypothetical protein